MVILAAVAFAAVLALCAMVLVETFQGNTAKMIAALDGRSWLSQPVMVTRPVAVRIVSRKVSRPVSVRPQLRAAA